MFNMKNYFAKNGFIYGVSSKYIRMDRKWAHSVYVFKNMTVAVSWLHTEQADFKERELCSKNRAIELAGKRAVDNAIMLLV